MNLTLELENEIRSFVSAMKSVWIEADDLYKMYFSAGPSSELSGLSSGDPATLSTRLTKAEIVNGITLVENLTKFFSNQAVSQSDYMATMQTILYGNDPKASALSVAVEAVGTRLYNLSGTLLAYNNKAKAILDYYTDTEISAAVAAISDETIVFGANSTKALFASGITLVEQFKKMLNNEAVTTGDYASTLAKWEQVP
jgi:hypothetical protein